VSTVCTSLRGWPPDRPVRDLEEADAAELGALVSMTKCWSSGP